MRRREFVCSLGALPVLGSISSKAFAATPFSGADVARLAKKLSLTPFADDTRDLPASLAAIDYDAYRNIRFASERALWRDQGAPFQAEFFHRGFYFKDRVDLYEVVNGAAAPIPYSASQFSFAGFDASALPKDLGFAGFRMRGPLNAANGLDEIAAFLGASYFRAIGKDNAYGLSARGLALKTGDATGEEFPRFTSFWLERPAPDASSVTLHALMDSLSITGAYSFIVTPGESTIIDVNARLYPRTAIDKAGVAPLTSMFLFSPGDRTGFDDFREAVHDSDGLEIWNGAGERLWRPLTNPQALQESVFNDDAPRGFGLMQRARKAGDYHDYESRFEARPSLWVQPVGDWGRGGVHLVEIPTQLETFDNIVAFWRPEKPWRAGSEQRLQYRLSWGTNPSPASGLMRVSETRTGRGGPASSPSDQARLFAITFEGPDAGGEDPIPAVSASAGVISNIVLTPTPDGRGKRLTFELSPGDAGVVELRANLNRQQEAVSETWLYRWTHS